MTVGEALSEARYRAGLTVDEVSERTRIREAVIRCIEQDDYEACGGDLYVRGYVRAIAGAIGIDAQPLIREYDAGRAQAPGGGTPAANAVPAVPEIAHSEIAHSEIAATAITPAVAAAPDVTVFDLPAVPADPEPDPWSAADPEPDPWSAADPEPDPWSPAAPDTWSPAADPGYATAADPGFTTAEWQYTVADKDSTAADQWSAADPGSAAAEPQAAAARADGPPRQPSPWRGRIRGQRWGAGIVVLVAVVLAVVGVAGSHIISSLRHTHTASAANIANPGNAAKQKAGNQTAQNAGATPAPSASASAVPTPANTPSPAYPSLPPPAASVRSLPIASVAAFGPDGVADGDNPQIEQYVITPGSAVPWQTDWYTTPHFGMLKQGTGLLLDMGTTVTVVSVRMDLSPDQGTDLQVRAARTASLGDLRVVARASDVGGTVRLRLASPVRARYLLIWFTMLPPDGMGTYQENVYRVVVNGRS